MKFLRREVTGIDLGKRFIKLVESRRQKNFVFIKKAGLIELPENYSDDIFLDIAVDAIHKNRKVNKINLDNVAIVCPTHVYSSQNITLPPMPKKELVAAIQWEIKKSTGLNPEELNIDYYPNRSSEREVEYLVYYAEREKIDAIVNKFLSYEINVRYVDVDEMAELACFASLYSDDGTVKGFFDCGATHSRLILAKSGTLYLKRELSDFLRNVFEVLKGENFEDITYKEAIEFRGLQDNIVSSHVVRYLNELIYEIMRSIDYFMATYKMPAPTNIFLSGGLFCIPGVYEYFKSNMSIPVTLNNVLELCGYEDKVLLERGFNFNLALGASLR